MTMRMRGVGLTLLLGALAALPPLSIDLALPALPSIGKALDASPGTAGQTLSLFMLGFAGAQLAFGPLSDKVGRKPVLIAGLSLFAAAGAACALAQSITVLLGSRLLQGVGAGAGTVLAFAIVRDLFDGNAARAKLSLVSVVLSVAPVVAPTLGAAVLAVSGWRGVYAFLAFAGVTLLGAVIFRFDETRVARPENAGCGGMWRKAGVLRPVLVNALSFGGMFAYVAGSPALFLDVYRVSPLTYGALFASTAGGLLLGAALNERLARRTRAEVVMMIGLLIAAATALSLAALFSKIGTAPILLVLPLLIANTFALGLISPNASHLALASEPDRPGAVSSLLGFTQMASGAVSSALVTLVQASLGPSSMPIIMAGCAALSLAVSLRCLSAVALSDTSKEMVVVRGEP